MPAEAYARLKEDTLSADFAVIGGSDSASEAVNEDKEESRES
jgi:hypothetical protein